MRILPCLLAVVALVGATKPTPLALRLEIRSLPADSTPVVELRLTLPPSADSVTTLALPNEWAGWPSLHRGILELRAESAGARIEAGSDSSERRLISPPGKPTTIRWIRRPSWKGQMPAGAHNLSDFGRDWFQLIGNDAFVLPKRDQSAPVQATIVFRGLPRGAIVATSFGSGARSSDTIVSARTEMGQLLEAAYLVGNAPRTVRLFRVPVHGKAIDVAVRGSLTIPDSAIVSGVKRVVSAERSFWNDQAPATYLVSVGEASRGTLAGVRLTNAFAADIDPSRPALDAGVLTLLGHEMGHEWIGGALHPAPGVPDGHLSWFTEGFTDYASTRLLRNAGIITDSAYLAIVNGWLSDYATSPARDLTWADVEERHWKDPTVQRQPYLRGALFGLRIDALARVRHDSLRVNTPAPTLDAAIRTMMTSDHGRPVVLTERSITSAFTHLLGASLAADEVTRITRGGERMPMPTSLLGACFTQADVDRAIWDTGFDLDGSLPARVVRGVRAGTRAERAGLKDGMQLRGLSVYRGDITKQVDLRVRAAGDTVDRHVTYLPLSDTTVRVTVLSPRPGC